MTGQTARSYASPYRPRLITLLNRAGAALSEHGVDVELTAAGLMREARRQSGLDDFGDQGFIEPLEELLDSVESEARLHTLGRLITKQRLLGVLGNRLRAQRIFSQNPWILERPVAPPIVITGLQRTGTTMLHRLLGADAGMRVLASWEAINPAAAQGARWAAFDGPGEREDALLCRARFLRRASRRGAPTRGGVDPARLHLPEPRL